MELDPRENLRSGKSVAEAPAAPLAGTARESFQRLQVGLFGLGSMVLMLGLANIITSSAQQNQAAIPEDLPPVTSEDVPPPPPRDPLAEAGVVPNLPATQGAEVEAPLVPEVEGKMPPPLLESGDVPPPAPQN